MKNPPTDIPGFRVGRASDPALTSGVTVVLFDSLAIAAVDMCDDEPGTRVSALSVR